MASVRERTDLQESLLRHGGKLFINNQWVDASSGKTLDVFDPATGAVMANVAAADKEDVDVAVKAARHAFDGGKWSHAIRARAALVEGGRVAGARFRCFFTP